MKKICFFLFLSFSLFACNKDNDPPANASTPEALRTQLAVSGGWLIAVRVDEGRDMTSMYANYLFVFNMDGTVVASRNGQSVTGRYMIVDSFGKLELKMDFPDGTVLYELSDDWYFVSQGDGVKRFEDSGNILEFRRP